MSKKASRGPILVVDDSPAIVSILAYRLRKEGYDVAEASSSERAMDSAARVPPRLAFIDVRIPGGGYELSRQLRSSGNVILVFMSGADTDEVRREARRHGAIGFLAKPFRMEEVLELARLALGTR